MKDKQKFCSKIRLWKWKGNAEEEKEDTQVQVKAEIHENRHDGKTHGYMNITYKQPRRLEHRLPGKGG